MKFFAQYQLKLYKVTTYLLYNESASFYKRQAYKEA